MTRPNLKRANAVLHRRQKCQEEWARTSECHDLIHMARVAAAVNERTGGQCYITGCPGGIISYPHAVPIWEHGVHHQVNRAGVCGAHAQALHAGGQQSEAYRLVLQERLQDWYAERGISPERWRALASGRDPIYYLTHDVGEDNSAAVG